MADTPKDTTPTDLVGAPADKAIDVDDALDAGETKGIDVENVNAEFPGPHWVTEANAEIAVKVGKTGASAEAPVTVFDLFKQTVSVTAVLAVVVRVFTSSDACCESCWYRRVSREVVR